MSLYHLWFDTTKQCWHATESYFLSLLFSFYFIFSLFRGFDQNNCACQTHQGKYKYIKKQHLKIQSIRKKILIKHVSVQNLHCITWTKWIETTNTGCTETRWRNLSKIPIKRTVAVKLSAPNLLAPYIYYHVSFNIFVSFYVMFSVVVWGTFYSAAKPASPHQSWNVNAAIKTVQFPAAFYSTRD